MKLSKIILATASCALFAMAANAEHSWSTYHWATTDGTVHLPSVDRVTPDWQMSYEDSLAMWNSTHIDNVNEQGDESSKTRKRCTAELGKMVTCNAAYGRNGWAGLASINLDSNGHITQGVAKMNDTYMANYGEVYRNHVMCQEIGHVYGLGHTSEDGSSQSTCMDYSSSTNASSQWPNAHDFEQLALMYNHDDGYATATDTGGTVDPTPCRGGPKKCGSGFSVKIMQNKHSQIWVTPGANGSTWVTHVTLAEGFDDIVHLDGQDIH